MPAPEVTPEVAAMVDQIREMLLEDYAASEEEITMDVTLWADGDFVVKGKAGVQDGDVVIDGEEFNTRTIRHILRYKHWSDDGIMYRENVAAEDYETEIEPLPLIDE